MPVLARRVVFLDRERVCHGHRVRYRWDGALDLAPARLPASGRFVLVLDPSHPFRRRFQLAASGRHTRRALNELAPELFPASDEERHYALGELEGECYVFALPGGRLRESIEGLPRAPDAVLVGPGHGDGLRRTLALWVARGRPYDLLGRRRPVPRSVMLTLLLAAAASAFLPWATADLVDRIGAEREARRAELEQMRASADRLARKRIAIAHMGAAYQALGALAAGDLAPRLLRALLGHLPGGVELRSIAFDGQALRVTGWDPHDLDWIGTLPGRVEVIEHEPLPERDWFEIKLEGGSAP